MALCRIYEKYRDCLLRVAAALLDDRGHIEDVFHDVFVHFAQTAGRFELKGSLRGFLSICIANRARDVNRTSQRRGSASIDELEEPPASGSDPEKSCQHQELAATIEAAMARLPEEQRLVLVLHLQGALSFREIAELGEVSINTAMSRYRYGLEKVRSILDERISHA